MYGKWIWISDPHLQVSNYNLFSHTERPYCMAQFRRTYSFDKPIVRGQFRVSGDVRFRLFLNGKLLLVGPAAVGGDFEMEDRPFGRYFAQRIEVPLGGTALEFSALVQQQPVRLTDISRGHGGFLLEGTVFFADGTQASIGTDGTWQARQHRHYVDPFTVDMRREECDWEPAVQAPDIWDAQDAPIRPLSHTKVLPTQNGTWTLRPGETLSGVVMFDKIYAAHPVVDYTGDCTVRMDCMERPDKKSGAETLHLCGQGEYCTFGMHSVGELHITAQNTGTETLTLRFSILFVCYPVEQCGTFVCSDGELNRVYEVCRHTLQICRQTLHLDSPMHQELMACTGDYYIESLMTAMTFGDLDLAKFDISRTADILREKQGVMFHTTYSMIYVQMVYDTYMYTADKGMVEAVWDALDILMERMHGYVDESGLVNDPPSYMFFDWMVRDGVNMHHPPRSMGQGLLCAFYFGALQTMAKLSQIMGDAAKEQRYLDRAQALGAAMNEKLYDSERRLYFDGLDGEAPVNQWTPENVPGRFFSKHVNILCALYGVCAEAQARDLVERVLFDETLLDMQPYFMHFALEAVYKVGLFPKYGIQLLSRWKPMVKACGKGLQEGWFKPTPEYTFDYSHAWGGTPAYQLPHKLLGLSMVEPGWKAIRLNPSLYGLDSAQIAVPTPYGMLRCRMEKGETALEVPPQIRVL